MLCRVLAVVFFGGVVSSQDAAVTTDVLILGAGAAGIGASSALHEQGIDFIILEGRKEIGGRVRNHKMLDGTTVEMGANWIYESNNNPIYQAAKQINLADSLTDWSNCKIGTFSEATGSIRCQDTRKPRQRLDSAVACAWGKSENIQHEFLGQTFPSGMAEADFTCPLTQPAGTDPDVSYDKALEKCGWAGPSDAVEEALQWFGVDWWYAANPDQVGLSGASPSVKQHYGWGAAWNDASCEMNSRFVEDQRGYKSVFDKIGESFLTGSSASGEPRLVLGARVVRIEYDDQTVRVTTRQAGGVEKVYVAKHAIVTFSTGVLQRSKSDTEADLVRFQPPLPHWKKTAIDRLPLGQFSKLFLRFESPCWDDKPWFMLGAEEKGKFPMWANYNMLSGFEGSNILAAFQIGDQSRASEAASEEEQLADVMRHLRMMFPSCPDPIEHFFTSWSTDEWTFGAYSYRPTKVHNSEARVLAHPVKNLHFAGEATSPTLYGYVHGAFITGQQSAYEIAACRKGSSVQGVDCPSAYETLIAKTDPKECQVYTTTEAPITKKKHKSATACRKCVTTGKGVTCCGKGGAWEGKCGSPGNPKFEHTWAEGFKACLTASSRSAAAKPKPVAGCAGWCKNNRNKSKCTWRVCSACPSCAAASAKPSPTTPEPATPPHAAAAPTKPAAGCAGWCKNNPKKDKCTWRVCSSCPFCLATTPKSTATNPGARLRGKRSPTTTLGTAQSSELETTKTMVMQESTTSTKTPHQGRRLRGYSI